MAAEITQQCEDYLRQLALFNQQIENSKLADLVSSLD
jgi:hypothetical protein